MRTKTCRQTLVSCIILRTRQGSLAENNVERHNARTLASVQPFWASHASGTISVPLPATSSGRSPNGSNACRLPGTTGRVVIGKRKKKTNKNNKEGAITGSSSDVCECDSCTRSTRQAWQLIQLALWAAQQLDYYEGLTAQQSVGSTRQRL